MPSEKLLPSENDLIRRGDAIAVVKRHYSHYDDHYGHCFTECLPEELNGIAARVEEEQKLLGQVARAYHEYHENLMHRTERDFTKCQSPLCVATRKMLKETK